MTELRILVESSEDRFIATVRDEFGVVCGCSKYDKDAAVARAKVLAAEQIDGELLFTVEDMVP